MVGMVVGMVSDIHSTMNLPNTTQTHKHGLKVFDYSVWLLSLGKRVVKTSAQY
jgi:hypothetical protein